MHREFVGSFAGKGFSWTPAAKPARPGGAQGVFVLLPDPDFSVAVRCDGNSGGGQRRGRWTSDGPQSDSAEKHPLETPLVRGERVGGLREDLLEVFEGLEKRIRLLARPDPMLAA